MEGVQRWGYVRKTPDEEHYKDKGWNLLFGKNG